MNETLPPPLVPLPGCGSHMPKESFLKATKGKWFIKPGYAKLATETGISEIVVTLSTYEEIVKDHPWATYVVWFFLE